MPNDVSACKFTIPPDIHGERFFALSNYFTSPDSVGAKGIKNTQNEWFYIEVASQWVDNFVCKTVGDVKTVCGKT